MPIPHILKQHQARILLILILLFSTGLHLMRPEHFDIGNPYYTATVDNLLRSPSNFFYATADDGAVTVDKPPVALWIQAGFAMVLGVKGWVMILPSILAGLASILVLYHLVARQFGQDAGLISAFVMTVTPITPLINRTNNLDSLLVFFLLLATWAYIKATETGRWRELLLGAFLMSIAFNVKMLQAYLILPALYALYFFASSSDWWRKIIKLSISSLVLLLVSFSWVLIVDSVDASKRPYVGGSQVNSAVDLVIGYNGVERLLGVDPANASGIAPQLRPTVTNSQGVGSIGNPGIFRFFEASLANEFSWVLPLALISILLLIWQNGLHLPQSKEGQAVMLWGVWLLVGVGYLSISEFIHAYYLATLSPALASLVGIGTVKLWQLRKHRPLATIALAGTVLIITLAYQWQVIAYYDVSIRRFALVLSFCISILLIGGFNWWQADNNVSQKKWELALALAYLGALLLIPSYWTAISIWQGSSQVMPLAYSNVDFPDFISATGPPRLDFTDGDLNILDLVQVDPNVRYDLAVTSAVLGAPIVINSDLRVLYLGGFSGNDPIYDLYEFAEMISSGQIGFVMTSDNYNQSLLYGYTSSTCTLARTVIPPREIIADDGQTVIQGGAVLYDCFSE